MAVPKHKKCVSRTRSRKAQNVKFQHPTVQACPICGTPARPHRVCVYCGHYKNEPVVVAEGYTEFPKSAE